MPEADWLANTTSAFRLAMATAWLAPAPFQEHQERAIRQGLAAGPDWAEYLALLDRHGIPALSWAALNRVPGIVLPSSAAQELRRRSDTCRIQAMQRSLLLAEALKAFNRAGIPAMPLKGPALSFELYGDVGMRYSTDLDLQVPQENVRAAVACLENAGWGAGYGFHAMSPRQQQSFLRNGYEIAVVHARTGHAIELHWRNHWETPEAAAARWARSTTVPWQGLSIQAMSSGDLALFLCTHGAYHVWSSARWLSDVARAHALGRIDWNAAFAEARKLEMEPCLRAALSLLNCVYGLLVPDLDAIAGQSVFTGRSSLLVEMPLQSLRASTEPRGGIGFALLRNHMRTVRYERLVRPRKTLRQSFSELFYCVQDFGMISLPDRFFWAYKPLRPILWIVRSLQQARQQDREQLAPRAN